MSIEIPNAEKKIIQTNRSDFLGNILASCGLDLQSNVSRVRLAERLRVLTKTGDANATTMGRPIGFEVFLSKYWTVAGSKVYNNTGKANTAFVEDTTSGTPTTCDSNYSDIKFFNTRIWVSTAALLKSCTSVPSWNTQLTFGSSAVPHPLCFFEKLNRLYFVDNYGVIGSVSAAYVSNISGDYSIGTDVPLPYPATIITCMDRNSSSIWFGTNAVGTNRNALVYQWDGLSAQPTAIFELKAKVCCAIKVKDDVPYVMDSDGVWSKFTGQGFEEVGRLPTTQPLFNYGSLLNNRFIHPNGIEITKNGTFEFLLNGLNNDSAGTQGEYFPSGVWEWSEANGFTHKKPVTYNVYGSTTVTDLGQFRVSSVGALVGVDDGDSTGLKTLMAGATYYTDATATASGIFIEDTLDTIQKSGYLISTFNESLSISDMWNMAYAFHKKFLTSTDKMILKYRQIEDPFTEATITWLSTTSFTAQGISGFKKGDEVHVVQGTGSGMMSHITSISSSNNVFTVTVDETHTGATGTGIARFQKWKKAAVINDADDFDKVPVNAEGNCVQVKLFMIWTGKNELKRLLIPSQTSKQNE